MAKEAHNKSLHRPTVGRPERTANNQLELLPMPGFFRRIAVTDENDLHMVLEKLHEKWADATEEKEKNMSGDPEHE